jgi:hypothetical protein
VEAAAVDREDPPATPAAVTLPHVRVRGAEPGEVGDHGIPIRDELEQEIAGDAVDRQRFMPT